MSEQPPTRVYTGAGGHPGALHLLVGLVGWVLWAALIVWLASEASNDALDVALFLTTVIVTVAFLLVLTGAGLLRASLMRERGRTPARVRAELERPLPIADSPAELTGEIELEIRDGVRRYSPVARAGP